MKPEYRRSFPGRLVQDQLVEGEICTRLAQPLVLNFKIFHPPDLVALQTAVLFAPTIVRDLRHADGYDRLDDAMALRYQNIHLPQLGEYTLRLVPLRSHLSVRWGAIGVGADLGIHGPGERRCLRAARAITNLAGQVSTSLFCLFYAVASRRFDYWRSAGLSPAISSRRRSPGTAVAG